MVLVSDENTSCGQQYSRGDDCVSAAARSRGGPGTDSVDNEDKASRLLLVAIVVP